MAHKYYVFVNPSSALCQIFHDSGWNGIAYAAIHPSGRQGQVFDIPDTIEPNQGARLHIGSENYMPMELRGILTFADEQYAYMQCDDFTLTGMAAPVPPPTTDGPPNNSPEAIINWVFNSGGHNLSTKEGCGQFTEDCCTELHERNSELWGHVRKNPGQNQYNTHAVDAVQCLGGQYHGIWDIIFDSTGPNAHPQFNRADEAAPELWCYPAASCGAQAVKSAKKKK